VEAIRSSHFNVEFIEILVIDAKHGGSDKHYSIDGINTLITELDLLRTIVAPTLGPNVPQFVEAGFIKAGVVVILTWIVMPFVVRAARPWLLRKTDDRETKLDR
jgi:hypothetical protein